MDDHTMLRRKFWRHHGPGTHADPRKNVRPSTACFVQRSSWGYNAGRSVPRVPYYIVVKGLVARPLKIVTGGTPCMACHRGLGIMPMQSQ